MGGFILSRADIAKAANYKDVIEWLMRCNNIGGFCSEGYICASGYRRGEATIIAYASLTNAASDISHSINEIEVLRDIYRPPTRKTYFVHGKGFVVTIEDKELSLAGKEKLKQFTKENLIYRSDASVFNLTPSEQFELALSRYISRVVRLDEAGGFIELGENRSVYGVPRFTLGEADFLNNNLGIVK